MNIIALDIGNTNVTVGFFLDNNEQFIKTIPGDSIDELSPVFKSAWEKIPFVESAKEKNGTASSLQAASNLY